MYFTQTHIRTLTHSPHTYTQSWTKSLAASVCFQVAWLAPLPGRSSSTSPPWWVDWTDSGDFCWLHLPTLTDVAAIVVTSAPRCCCCCWGSRCCCCCFCCWCYIKRHHFVCLSAVEQVYSRYEQKVKGFSDTPLRLTIVVAAYTLQRLYALCGGICNRQKKAWQTH